MFYRDIYWKFPYYKESTSAVQRLFTIPMYYYDLIQYKKYLDIFYLPSLKMNKFIPIRNIAKRVSELPPGGIFNEEVIEKVDKRFRTIEENYKLNIF